MLKGSLLTWWREEISNLLFVPFFAFEREFSTILKESIANSVCVSLRVIQSSCLAPVHIFHGADVTVFGSPDSLRTCLTFFSPFVSVSMI
jgi:hypothetical protein